MPREYKTVRENSVKSPQSKYDLPLDFGFNIYS